MEEEETLAFSDEALQRLGVEEYPERDDPQWMGGFDLWWGGTRTTAAANRLAHEAWQDVINRTVEEIQEANRRRVQATIEAQYQQASNLVFDMPPIRFEPMEPLYSEGINPIRSMGYTVIHGQSPLWTIVDEVAPVIPTEPELNMDNPSYENLQEMMRIAEENIED